LKNSSSFLSLSLGKLSQVPEWHNCGLNPKFSAFQGVGDGLDALGSIVAGTAKPLLRAAAEPKPLTIATPIPNWSRVMGPIDSAK
jgi:hypothetical protein